MGKCEYLGYFRGWGGEGADVQTSHRSACPPGGLLAQIKPTLIAAAALSLDQVRTEVWHSDCWLPLGMPSVHRRSRVISSGVISTALMFLHFG